MKALCCGYIPVAVQYSHFRVYKLIYKLGIFLIVKPIPVAADFCKIIPGEKHRVRKRAFLIRSQKNNAVVNYGII